MNSSPTTVPIDFTLFSQPSIHDRWPGNCFGCSGTNPIGLHLHFWHHEKACWSKITIPDNFCGFNKIAHGGIIATLLDEIAAWGVGLQLLKLGVTLTATIRYIRAVPTGTELYLKGMITAQEGDTVKTWAGLMNAKGIVLSDCESTWKIPTVELLAKISNVPQKDLEKMIEYMLKTPPS